MKYNATHEAFCSNPGCQVEIGFVHTDQGMKCMGCQQVAHLSKVEEHPSIPFGITRQLEELDRMYAL